MTEPRLYLVDKSALVRMAHAEVRESLRSIFEDGTIATCSIIDLEVLYSARSPEEYESILNNRSFSYRKLPLTQAVCDRAVDIQRTLATKSQHRGAGLADLLIAACADVNDATVLHYDSDYDLISAITGQPAQWVVPRGTIL